MAAQCFNTSSCGRPCSMATSLVTATFWRSCTSLLLSTFSRLTILLLSLVCLSFLTSGSFSTILALKHFLTYFSKFQIFNFYIDFCTFLVETYFKSLNSFLVFKITLFVKYHLELLWSYILTQKIIQRLFLSFYQNAETNPEFWRFFWFRVFTNSWRLDILANHFRSVISSLPKSFTSVLKCAGRFKSRNLLHYYL